MSFILKRVEVGQVGDLPGQLLLESTDDLVTITSPGYLSIADGVLATDIIECVYGNPMTLKQIFNPVIGPDNIITLQIIGGGGSINGAVNLGTGEGLLGVSGSNITGKSLIAGANISLTPTGTDITIAATGAGGGTITGIADVATHDGNLAAGTSGADVLVKSLIAGSNVVITENSTSVTIAATNSSTGLTTLANLPGGEGIYTTTVGTTAQLKSIAAGAGISVTSNPDNIIITNTGGGGGGGFDYIHTFWLAQNGNDANNGLSIDKPKLTMDAIAAALTPGVITVLNIVDSGIYPIATTFTVSCPLLINAPGATFTWSGAPSGNMFFLNTFSPLIVNAGFINGANTLQVFRGFSSCILTGPGGYCNTANTNRIWEDANTISPNGVPQAEFNISTDTAGGAFVFKFSGEQIVNATNLGDSVFSSQLINGSVLVKADEFNGALTGTANYNLTVNSLGAGFNPTTTGTVRYDVFETATFVSPSATTLGQIANNLYGNLFSFGQINGQPLNVINWTVPQTNNLTALNYQTYANAFIFYTGTGGYGRFNLTDDAGIPVGFQVWMFQVNDGSGNATGAQATYSSNPIISTGTMSAQVAYTRTGGSWIKFVKVSQAPNSQWAAFGDIFNSASTFAPNIYISKLNGTDNSSTIGTLDSQFATINAALTYVIATYTATPAHGINLVITDDESYNEKLDFTGTSNIHLLGRTAQIVYASSGGGDDGFTSNAPQQFVSVAELATTGGGRTVNYTGAGALILNVDVLGNGNVENNGAGILFAQVYGLQGTTVNAGGGQFRYTSLLRSGTDGLGVIGTASDGASEDWTVLRNLRAPDNLFVQSTPVAFNVASLTITSAFLKDRIIVNNNAGPSTWTLDTAANLNAAYPGIQSNDAFSVFVSNATGATVTFVASAGTTVTGTPTSATNFTFWMRYVGGLWELYY